MAQYTLGIDLGTTNCAVSYFSLASEQARRSDEGLLALPQLTAPGVVEARPLLPSFCYLPGAAEFPVGSLELPWRGTRDGAAVAGAKAGTETGMGGTNAGSAAETETGPGPCVGAFARTQGAKSPGRLIHSAKSWLCHAGVDRQAPILPWQGPAELKKRSPLEVSALYLEHLRRAWDAAHPEAPFAAQEIVLTVPASFDAAARELTLGAARRAGYPDPILLEEPQAAFYAWIEQAGGSFRKQLRPGDLVLVVDVGGGTSDFSLIAVGERAGEFELTRVAVGDHILLGGDNMDLALAYHVNQRLTAEGRKLDAWQLAALTHACRAAKEQLYGDGTLVSAPLTIPGRGSSLIGGTLRTELRREELERVLTEGFFPACAADEAPRTARRTGLAQMALPYAQDPAVTRHLAAFLARQARALEGSPDAPLRTTEGRALVHPTAVLFNGGVFKAEPLRRRVLEVLNAWLAADGGGAPARELAGAELDLAVARGAAYYGWVRHGHGLRIRGGTAQAYYVGVESAMPAVPGYEPPVRALCVAPFGMEEGSQADMPPEEFGVVVGEPARFRFFTSSVRREDRVGALVDDPAGSADFEELAPIETLLQAADAAPGALVPVRLQAAVTELGLLELRCLQKDGTGRWKLELNVRLRE